MDKEKNRPGKTPLPRDWKVGDYVRFAHVPDAGPSYKVLAIVKGSDGSKMLEIEGMTGQFGAHIFVPGEGGHGDASH
jgi:hypothetical protein